MIEAISHITFIVHNIEKASKFFKTVLEAEELYTSGNQNFSIAKEKFFLVGGVWIAIMEGESLADRTYNHTAFKISEEQLEVFENRVKKLGLEIMPPRSRVEGEGHSLYFYDYDNHLFELHTGTLREGLERYRL